LSFVAQGIVSHRPKRNVGRDGVLPEMVQEKEVDGTLQREDIHEFVFGIAAMHQL
jgi:hypothetical protein